MRKIILFLVAINFTLGFAQSESHKKVVKLINESCLGTPIIPGDIQKVTAKFIDRNILQISEETFAWDNLRKKNVFKFKLSDLDTENFLISQKCPNCEGDDKMKFKMEIYCKNFDKKIRQDAFLGNGSTSYSEVYYMGDFIGKNVLEEIRDELIKIIMLNVGK